MHSNVRSFSSLIYFLTNRLRFNSCLGRKRRCLMSDELPRPASIVRRIIGPLQITKHGNLDLVSYCDYRFHFPIYMHGDRGLTISPDFISPQVPMSGVTPTPISP
jgi:hypothetical protein